VIRRKTGGGQRLKAGFGSVIKQMVGESQQFVPGHVAKNGRAGAGGEMGVGLAAAVVVNDDFQEIGFGRQLRVTARRAKNWVERVHMFDVKADLELLADGFDRSVHFGEDLVLGGIEQPVPGDDLRVSDEQSPELY